MAPLRVTLVGTGAVGTVLAAALAEGGAAVSAIGRGAAAAALAEGRMRLSVDGTERRLPALGPPDAVQPPDVVLTSVKAHQLDAALADPRVGALLAAAPLLVPALNGWPFWYARGLDDPRLAAPLDTVDTGGTLDRATADLPVAGAVLNLTAERTAPDRVVAGPAPAITLGDPFGPDGPAADRLDRLAEALAAGGVAPTVTPAIRAAMWNKLWGNAALNPVTALTGLGVGPAAAEGADVVLPALAEVQAVAAAAGIDLPGTPDQRAAVAARLGAHRTSMLQDLDAGRPTEIDAIAAAVAEVGRRLAVATPVLDALVALVRLREAAVR
jgi:2-dehydropantoate 2-reductase